MHSFGHRANAVATFAVTILAAMCFAASFSDNFNSPSPTASVKVFVFVAAEYETSQNALNQVSLWDGIIPSKEHAKFLIHTTNKYRFIDQASTLLCFGSNLKGKDFNLTMHWHIMPKTGKMFADKIVMTGYRLPEQYR
ncbi:hypothetical protein ABZP36_033995 [Zizania latifolia]